MAGELDTVPRGTTSRVAAGLSPASVAIERSVAVMTFANITREPADDWIGSGIAETVSSDLKNIHGLTLIGRARVFDALRNLSLGRASRRVAGDRRRPPAGRHLGRRRRIPAPRRARPHHRELRRRRHRRSPPHRESRRPHRRHLRAAGQDRVRAQSGPEPGAARHGDRRHRKARDAFGRGLRELRARDDEPAPGVARLDRARDLGVRGSHPSGSGVRDGLGRARRRVLAQGLVPLDSAIWSARRVEMERRAVAIDPELADAHMWLGSALLNLGQVDDAIASIERSDQARARERPGLPGARPRVLGREGRLRRRDSGVPQGDRAQPRGGLFVPAARPAARLGRQVRGSRGHLPPRRRAPGSVHLGQRRPAGRRRQRAARLRVLPAGSLRGGDSRVRARAGVRRRRAITRSRNAPASRSR